MDRASILEALARNLRTVQGRIHGAAERVRHDPGKIQLVAVSKTVEPARILAAYELGLRLFGENRVEEAEKKIPTVNTEIVALGGAPASWHLIGHLQSRKASRAVQLFDLIHSVDSVHLAEKLDRQAAAIGKKLPILLELNISGEEAKFGFPVDLGGVMSEQAPVFVRAIQQILALPNLSVRGVMTMAPMVGSPELARPYFRRLREWRDFLAARFPEQSWTELSMGMTDDFEVAIEEGSTMLRLGRAIFHIEQN
jgi:pyridoxal phosphate enzyme (YggS family)